MPSAFVWTKMGAESGEALAAIVRRKDYERQLGGGSFAWGIGNALGGAVDALIAEVGQAITVFSAMPSKSKKEDERPGSVLLWTAYEDQHRQARPLPAHMVVTSRGTAGVRDKTRHYALFCHAQESLSKRSADAEGVAPVALRNLTTGNPLGASQVTAVVRNTGIVPSGARMYPVAFMASLAEPRYARLLAPRVMSETEIADMASAAQSGFDAWAQFARQVRQS